MYIRELDQFFKSFIKNSYANNDFLASELEKLRSRIKPYFTSKERRAEVFFCNSINLNLSDDFKFKRSEFFKKNENLFYREDLRPISQRRLEGLIDSSEFSIIGYINMLKIALILAYENPHNNIQVYTHHNIVMYFINYDDQNNKFHLMISEELIKENKNKPKKNIKVLLKIFDGSMRNGIFAINSDYPVESCIELEYEYDLDNIDRREFIKLLNNKTYELICLKGLCGETVFINAQVYSESKLIDEFIYTAYYDL